MVVVNEAAVKESDLVFILCLLSRYAAIPATERAEGLFR